MMKRIFALMLSAFIIISITACKKAEVTDEPEIGTQTEKNVEIKTIQVVAGEGYKEESADNGYATIIKASYPVVMPYYEDENKFPGLKKALEDSNKSTREYQLKFIDQNLEFAKEMYDEDDEYYQYLETSVTPSVRRADTLVTSILYYGYEYNGGMHGESYYYGENYDTKTGKELKLTDVVDTNMLSDAISSQLDKFYSDTFGDNNINLDEVIDDEELYSWTLDYNGITFYFMPYAIDSSSDSMVTVTLANEEYPDVLKQEYKEIPKSYGIELTPDVPFYYDVNGDGNIDEIRAGGSESNFGDSGFINLSVNGESFMEEEWFYGYNASFIHTTTGNYIYYELLRENDYRETVCFDIKSGVNKVGCVDGGLRRIYRSDDDFTTLQDALTNPENFTFQQTTQHLSTVTGYKEYFVGNEGVPESNDKMFSFNKEKMLTFTLLQNIEVDVYDEKQGTVNGKKTLKTNEEVFYYATDGEKYALLKCSDGTICRVECVFDNEEYYNKVNGIKLEELFDGIIFAG